MSNSRRIKNYLKFLLKLAFTIGAIYLVVSKADLNKIMIYVKSADVFYIALGLLALNVGQIFSGLRMRHYFASGGLQMTRIFAISLYYVGMLFNLILPGGIGGDGYKAYFLKKKYQFNWKTSVRLIVSGRGSGLLALVVFTLIYGFFSNYMAGFPYYELILIAALIGVFPCYSFLASKLLKETLPTQAKAFIYSLFVQGSVVITAILLLKSVGYEGDYIDYIILFMISSIVSIIPISVGGLGLREVTFFYAAPLMMLDAELGVTLSAIYYAVNALASLSGVFAFYWLGKIPTEEKSG